MALKLVSVNIEWDRHLDTALPFIRGRAPDVVCIQELLEPDIPLFTEAFGPYSYYMPMMQMDTPRGRVAEGNALFSRSPLMNTRTLQYSGSVGAGYVHSDEPETWDKDYELRALACADIEKDGVAYRIITTHFNWSQKGESTPAQKEAMERMLALLQKEEPFVLAGDFNAPRGGETFGIIASRYKDNIPAEYKTSIDVGLHRSGKQDGERLLRLMVDGLFSTPEYEVKNAKLTFGVSDHAAITADIERIG